MERRGVLAGLLGAAGGIMVGTAASAAARKPIRVQSTPTLTADWVDTLGVAPVNAIANEGFALLKVRAGTGVTPSPDFAANAAALATEPRLIKAASWRLLPGGTAPVQALALYNAMQSVGGTANWYLIVDLDMDGITRTDVEQFWRTWRPLAGGKRLDAHSSRGFWSVNFPGFPASSVPASSWYLMLEDVNLVPLSVRNDPARPTAADQVSAIDPNAFKVNYGGWSIPLFVQFTDNALVAGARIRASAVQISATELRNITT